MITGLAETKDTLCLNLGTAQASRYTGFAFNGLFELGGRYYGTNAAGIFLLEGPSDYAGVDALAVPVEGQVTLPTTDMEVANRKRCEEMVLQCRGGGLTVDATVDEAGYAENLPVLDGNETGVQRRRCKLPKGLKGNNWSFTLRAPAPAEILGAEVAFTPTGRTA